MQNTDHNGSPGCVSSGKPAEDSQTATANNSAPLVQQTPAEVFTTSPHTAHTGEQPRRERPPRIKPPFVPLDVHLSRAPDMQPTAEPSLPTDTVRVEYAIRIQGGMEIIADLESRFDLPLALREACLAKTDCDFPQLLNSIIVTPVVTQFREFLRDQIERYDALRTKQEPPPEAPASMGLKLPKSANGNPVITPPIQTKPALPTARMPAGLGTPFPKNGV